jgi:hypothetical protein
MGKILELSWPNGLTIECGIDDSRRSLRRKKEGKSDGD